MSLVNKVLVVGAGIAGPTVCYWLQKFGFSPTLIEKNACLRTGGQALDIRGVAVDLAKKMGIYEQVCAKRTQVQIGRYVDTDGQVLHEEEGERFSFREGDEVEIARGDLVEILMGMIEAIPSRYHQHIVGIDQSEHGVDVHFKDGPVETYDLVIGADGIHSATRRQVFEKNEYALVNLGRCFGVFNVPNYLHLDHSKVLCQVGQKLVTVASDRDPKVAEVGFMFDSPPTLKAIRDENEQRQYLRDTYQDFGWEVPKLLDYMCESDGFYFDSVTQVKMPSWTKGRVVLVGDAGYCASPLSGQGNNLAMIGAYILARELKMAGGDHVVAFDRYHKILRPFVEANQRLGVYASGVLINSPTVSEQVAEERSKKIMQEMKRASYGIELPEYE